MSSGRFASTTCPARFQSRDVVDGRQCLAVVTNEGSIHANTLTGTAGINNPPGGGATLWVFGVSGRNE